MKSNAIRSTLLVIALSLLPAAVTAGSEEDAIRQPALDYALGWYDGDATRMESALHPELAKRQLVAARGDRPARIDQMGAMRLVQGARKGLGRKPEGERRADIAILDRFEDIAVLRVDFNDFVDFLHVARNADGKWEIINVLWQIRPRPMPQ